MGGKMGSVLAHLLLLPLLQFPHLLGMRPLERELLSSELAAKICLHILLSLYLPLLLVLREAVGPRSPKMLPQHLPSLIMAGP